MSKCKKQITSNFILLCRFQNYIHDIKIPPFNLDTIIGESGQYFATKAFRKLCFLAMHVYMYTRVNWVWQRLKIELDFRN